MKKQILAFITASLLIFSLAGCKESSNPVPEGETGASGTQTQPVSSKSEPAVVKDQNLNPLTGEYNLKDRAVGKRPASVMVNNIKKAWPQNGIGSADICYEVVAEGGITRILAVFADYLDMPKIGSVRSVRHYYTELAAPLNTIFVHWGGSKPGYDAVKKRFPDHIDGMAMSKVCFTRDEALRKQKGAEYSNFTSGELIQKAIDKKKINTKGTANPGFKFDEKGGIKGDSPATDVSVKFSGYVTANFKYDQASNSYLKSEFGKPQTDNNSKKQISVPNVFVLYADIHKYQNHASLMDVDFSGGDGYYISNGTKTNIYWTKGEAKSPFRFQKSDGTELKVNPGKSWVCIVSEDFKGSTSIK